MCGIFACVRSSDRPPFTDADVDKLRACSHIQAHRGPDERSHRMCADRRVLLCHERLKIIDLTTGLQPIQGCTPSSYVIHNGEIYNHQAIRDVSTEHEYHTHCDSEVIVHMMEEAVKGDAGENMDKIATVCNKLDGVFAFCVFVDGKSIAARDPIGVKPLYYGQSIEGDWYFASEMKSIISLCDKSLSAFPPGHYFTADDSTALVQYYTPSWFDSTTCTNEVDLKELREALVDATEKRLMADVPLGVLLSGGLDSSLTASIAARATKTPLHSFTIALNEDAPDAVAARQVATLVGTIHHEVHFTVAEGIAAMEDIVYHLETYDVTSCRAGIPMYLLSQHIHNEGIKVVLSGEGADEILGGYLYFHNAPSKEEFGAETVERVRNLSTADVQRADKAPMAHSLEVRVPFLDRHFLDVAMSIRPEDKQPINGRMEKHILRKAFDVEPPYLPAEVLWRQKEQFSDGVGYNWIDRIIEHCASMVTDDEMATAAEKYPHNTPANKGALYIRRIFESKFGSTDNVLRTVRRWIPKWQLSHDPSGRASDAHLKCHVTGAVTSGQSTPTVEDGYEVVSSKLALNKEHEERIKFA